MPENESMTVRDISMVSDADLDNLFLNYISNKNTGGGLIIDWKNDKNRTFRIAENARLKIYDPSDRRGRFNDIDYDGSEDFVNCSTKEKMKLFASFCHYLSVHGVLTESLRIGNPQTTRIWCLIKKYT